MIDLCTLPAATERPAVRRCPGAACRHRLLPVQDHCPACGRPWRPEPASAAALRVPPPRPESPWERPAAVASLAAIGVVTVVPVAGAAVIVLVNLVRAALAAI